MDRLLVPDIAGNVVKQGDKEPQLCTNLEIIWVAGLGKEGSTVFNNGPRNLATEERVEVVCQAHCSVSVQDFVDGHALVGIVGPGAKKGVQEGTKRSQIEFELVIVIRRLPGVGFLEFEGFQLGPVRNRV